MKSTQPLKHISIRGKRGVADLPAAARAGHRHGVWGIALLMFVSLIFAGCGSHKGPEAGQPGSRVAILSITQQETDTRTEIAIEGSDQILQYTSFQLTEPLRLIVDITDADLAKFKDKIVVNKGPVIDITPSQVDNIARLEIALSQSVDTKVYQSGGKLMVELANPVEAAKASPEAITPAPVPEAPKEQAPSAEMAAPVVGGEAGTAKIVKSIKATGSKQGAKVIITADGTMKPNSFMIEGKRLVIDVPGAKSRVRPSVVPVRKGGLDKVRVGQHTTPEQKVRVVLDLTKPMDYTVTPEGNTLVVAMTIATSPKPEEKPQERATAQTQETVPAVTEKAEKEAPQTASQEVAPVVAPVEAATQERAEARQQPRATDTMVMGAKKYGGRRISLDLQDADLVNVLRLFGELANLNMILSPEVKGKVTVRLVNIPWDQAMEIILKMNGLGYTIEDSILRIATMGALAKEADDEVKTREAKKKAEDLITRIIPINYSVAGTIEPTIKKSLSSRGETVVDARTNTLIVKDIARNVDEIVTLIKQLDKPTPQIMIEARIVEASLTFNRQLGVQWGGNYNASPAFGNATGLNFPNTIAVTGGPQMGTTPSGNGNFLVNMPAAVGAVTGGGAVGFQFGSLNKALNLDLVLSALESTGEGKVISTPRVSALDNKEAKIEQGVSIPYATSQSGGATNVQFIDAKLSLTVTPHATPDNRIFMKIAATKNAPDPSVQGANGQPSIRKNEATTEILMSDGETAVIGGILVLDRSKAITKVPFFADIPLIGWLFKSTTDREDKRELLIFITPRIVKQDVI